MTRMLTAKPAPEPSPPSTRPTAPTLGGRTVLGTRAVSNPVASGSGARDVFGSARPANGRIPIFTDPQPDEGAQINDWPAVDSRAAANKENTKDAIPWKGEVLHQPGALPPRTPRIEVFREEVH